LLLKRLAELELIKLCWLVLIIVTQKFVVYIKNFERKDYEQNDWIFKSKLL